MAGAELETLNRLIAELRPKLHRYCARLMGSAFDGEDVVQEALASAAEGWREGIEQPERWLFRIAHNQAIDALRRKKRIRAHESEAGDDALEHSDAAADADARVAAAAGLAALQSLTTIERASLVLMDVLGYSAEETAQILSLTIPSVKAALHRGRTRLRAFADPPAAPAVAPSAVERARLRAYADRFNARDFDALRNLLAEDVRLDLVNRLELKSREKVSVYFTRYSESRDWQVTPGFAEGRPALLVRDPASPSGPVTYVILLEWRGDRLAVIHDFRHARYAMETLAVRDWP